MFNLLQVVNLANLALLLAVLILYQRSDLRYRSLLYGWLFGAALLILLGAAQLLGSSFYNKFSDFTILIFWLLTLAFAVTGVSENSGLFQPAFFLFLGSILGLAPLNLSWLQFFFSSSKLPAYETGYVSLLAFIYLFIWLSLTLKGHYFSLPLFSFNLTVANLPFVYKQLFLFILNLVHELFHLYSIVLLLPDHPYLNMWFYRLIKAVLDPNFSATVTVLLLLLPAAFFLIRQRQDWLQVTEPAGPEQRKRKAKQRSIWRWQSLLLCFWVLVAAQTATASLVKKPANPAPKEVIIDGANALITETNPFTRLETGQISKYLINYQNRSFRLIVLKQKNRTFKAALDACAICGWEKGYSQLASGDLLCNVCGTSIPLSSLGQSGGCNPVPLKIKLIPGGLTIKLKEIEKAASNVKGSLK